MGILRVNLCKINPDNNFNEDNSDTIILVNAYTVAS